MEDDGTGREARADRRRNVSPVAVLEDMEIAAGTEDGRLMGTTLTSVGPRKRSTEDGMDSDEPASDGDRHHRPATTALLSARDRASIVLLVVLCTGRSGQAVYANKWLN